MTITAAIREQVRQRANFACEFCGVTEIDTAGHLTIDHYCPKSKSGDDALDNLFYLCNLCNQYKADYWPQNPDEPALWNPRQEPPDSHFLELADGTLYPLTPTGIFTLNRLRLNRAPLIAHRLQRRQHSETMRLMTRLQDTLFLLERLHEQHLALLEEHRVIMAEQRQLIRLLLKDRA